MADKAADLHVVRSTQDILGALKDEIGGEGFQRQLDERHWVTFLGRGPQLLVSFEPLQHTLAAEDSGLPIGTDFVDDKNWSLLHFSAATESWFRGPALYDFVDHLVDISFFEEFDRVMFFGVGAAGYAAAAYSVAAPGSSVLAIRPQATLDPDRAGWDHRFPEARRLGFNDRYGYAPDMLEGARGAAILYDPGDLLDAVHASLFRGPNILRLKCRHLHDTIDTSLRQMDLLHRMIELAAKGALSEAVFYRLLRARRAHGGYLRNLVLHLDRDQKPLRTALVCAHALRRSDSPALRRKLAECRAILAARGPLPDWLSEIAAPAE